MPRKVNYGVDYDEDFYDYEDYNYDYDDGYDYEEKGGRVPETNTKKGLHTAGVWRCSICTFDNKDTVNVCDICGNPKQERVKSGMWHCPICTFDNEDTMNECDICGVLRNPLIKGKATATIDKVSQSNVLSSEKEIATEVKKELVAEEPVGSSASTAKVRRDDVKDRSSSTETRGNNGVTSKMTNMSVSSNPRNMETGSARGINGVANNMSNMSVSSNPRNVQTGNAASRSQSKPQKIVRADQIEDKLDQLNLAIVGHVDSGKSTLSGRLLHLLGQISQKEMHKYEKEAKQQGKGSFAYAWALDESAEERERGITMTVAVAYFNTKRYRVVLLDSPGHRDFVPNMISGATQADAAILVVDASIGAFEAGIDVTGGQTREHVQLVKSFGVDQIIIAINKMDAVGYSNERFDTIKNQLGTFLRACKFKDSSVLWIPLSAMENQNLVTSPSDARLLSWFQGPCLLDAIDSFQAPQRDYSKPVLMPICDLVKSPSQGQVSVCGKLETGALQTGHKVLVMPSREMATVRSLEHNSQVCNSAKAGDNVTINLQGIDANRVMAGDVLCDPEYPIAVSNHLELKILILDIAVPILIGSQLEFHVHHAKEAARVVRILSLLDPKTGKETKKSPRCLLSKQNAIIEVALQGMVCIEEHSKCKALGRVSLRASGRTIALGLVTRVLEKKD